MDFKKTIEWLVSGGWTETEAYNVLTQDLFKFSSEDEVTAAANTVRYFEAVIKYVCLPAVKVATAGREPQEG